MFYTEEDKKDKKGKKDKKERKDNASSGGRSPSPVATVAGRGGEDNSGKKHKNHLGGRSASPAETTAGRGGEDKKGQKSKKDENNVVSPGARSASPAPTSSGGRGAVAGAESDKKCKIKQEGRHDKSSSESPSPVTHVGVATRAMPKVHLVGPDPSSAHAEVGGSLRHSSLVPAAAASMLTPVAAAMGGSGLKPSVSLGGGVRSSKISTVSSADFMRDGAREVSMTTTPLSVTPRSEASSAGGGGGGGRGVRVSRLLSTSRSPRGEESTVVDGGGVRVSLGVSRSSVASGSGVRVSKISPAVDSSLGRRGDVRPDEAEIKTHERGRQTRGAASEEKAQADKPSTKIHVVNVAVVASGAEEKEAAEELADSSATPALVTSSVAAGTNSNVTSPLSDVDVPTALGPTPSDSGVGASPAGKDDENVAVGARVRIHGLLSTPELNGMIGTVVASDPRGERWCVRTNDGAGKNLHAANLAVVAKVSDEEERKEDVVASTAFPAAGRQSRASVSEQEAQVDAAATAIQAHERGRQSRASVWKQKGGGGGKVTVDARVCVVGLTSTPEVNGKMGTVVAWDSKKERWRVRMDDGGGKNLRIANLAVVAESTQEKNETEKPAAKIQEHERRGETSVSVSRKSDPISEVHKDLVILSSDPVCAAADTISPRDREEEEDELINAKPPASGLEQREGSHAPQSADRPTVSSPRKTPESGSPSEAAAAPWLGYERRNHLDARSVPAQPQAHAAFLDSMFAGGAVVATLALAGRNEAPSEDEEEEAASHRSGLTRTCTKTDAGQPTATSRPAAQLPIVSAPSGSSAPPSTSMRSPEPRIDSKPQGFQRYRRRKDFTETSGPLQVVLLKLIVRGLEFQKILTNIVLRAGLIGDIAAKLARLADVSEDAVSVRLSQGSLLVDATVGGLSAEGAAAAYGRLSEVQSEKLKPYHAASRLEKEVAWSIGRLPQITAATSGPITVSVLELLPPALSDDSSTRAALLRKLESAIDDVSGRIGHWLVQRRSKATLGEHSDSRSCRTVSRQDIPPLPSPALAAQAPPVPLLPFAKSDPKLSGESPSLDDLVSALPPEPRTEPHYPKEIRLAVHSLVDAYFPGVHDCTAKCGKSPLAHGKFLSVYCELEFSFWGTCPACQMQMFPTLSITMSREIMPSVIMVGGHGPFAELSPLASVPLAYPDRQTIWATPYQLFIAHHFVDPGWRAIVAAAPLGKTARALQKLLAVPVVRAGVRDDWGRGFAVRAMRHAVFLAVEQHPVLKQLLVATGHAQLIFSGGDHERFWGAAIDDGGAVVSGENLVGEVLMEKRRQLLVASEAEDRF